MTLRDDIMAELAHGNFVPVVDVVRAMVVRGHFREGDGYSAVHSALLALEREGVVNPGRAFHNPSFVLVNPVEPTAVPRMMHANPMQEIERLKKALDEADMGTWMTAQERNKLADKIDEQGTIIRKLRDQLAKPKPDVPIPDVEPREPRAALVEGGGLLLFIGPKRKQVYLDPDMVEKVRRVIA